MNSKAMIKLADRARDVPKLGPRTWFELKKEILEFNKRIRNMADNGWYRLEYLLPESKTWMIPHLIEYYTKRGFKARATYALNLLYRSTIIVDWTPQGVIEQSSDQL